jgi:hypothetical protein
VNSDSNCHAKLLKPAPIEGSTELHFRQASLECVDAVDKIVCTRVLL